MFYAALSNSLNGSPTRLFHRA
ncbi:hypothetical protein D046_0318A, partial [Vibrio parahaemolyticus V-223/04]